MRGWVLGVLLALGLVVVLVAAGNGRDHTGDTVRSAAWADDVCGTVGAWEGDLKAIRKDMQKNTYGARRTDGGSGDQVESNVTVREAVDRAIIATTESLQRGLKRAGKPDVAQGAQASAILQLWAQQTEVSLKAAKHILKVEPSTKSISAEAFQALAAPVAALTRSTVQGRAAFASVAALDPTLGDAIKGSGNCKDLQKERA